MKRRQKGIFDILRNDKYRRSSMKKNLFGVDVPNLQIFKSLKIKLNRDYLKFFTKLSKVYTFGVNKEQIDDAVKNILYVLKLIDEMLLTGIIDGELVDLIVINVEEVNQTKDALLEEADKSKRINETLKQVETETHISTEDINLTEDLIRQTARIEEKKIGTALRREMPRTRELGKETLKALGFAALGPFYAAVEPIVGLFKDLTERKKYKRSEEEIQLQKTILPLGRMGERTPSYGISSLIPRRTSLEQESHLGGFRLGRLDPFAPMVAFFSEGAYKAKWTKEVLNELKSISKSTSEGGISGRRFGLGTAVLGAGAAIATSQVVKAGQEFVGLEKSRTERKESAEQLAKTQEMWMEQIRREGLKITAEKAGKTPRQLAMDIVFREQRAEQEKIASRPWWSRVLPRWSPLGAVLSTAGGGIPPKMEPFYKRVEEIEKEDGMVPANKQAIAPRWRRSLEILPGISAPKPKIDSYKRVEEIEKEDGMVPANKQAIAPIKPMYPMDKIFQMPIVPKTVEKAETPKVGPLSENVPNLEPLKGIEESNRNLNESIKTLTNQLKEGTVSARQMKNAHDSADDLLRAHARGTLSIGGS